MKRRDFIAFVGGLVVAWPLGAGAQTTTPVVGFVSSLSARDATHIISAFHLGLKEAGYEEGRNVAIEYRWAEGQYDRLPALSRAIWSIVQ